MSLMKSSSKALFGIGSYAVYQILLLSLISKYYGNEILGAYAFFFAITASIFFLTNLGFRQLIVTSKKFTNFNQYLRIRLTLSLFALSVILSIALVYKNNYIWLCLCVGLIRLLESLSEINYAFFQKVEEHGFQSKLLFIKSAISILLVITSLFLGADLVVSLTLVVFTHLSILIAYEYPKLASKGNKLIFSKLITFSKKDLQLLMFAFPLGLGLFFINLNLNASRIVSGAFLTDVDTAVLAACLQLSLVAAPVITGICQVFLPRFSNFIIENKIIQTKILFWKLLIFLSVLGGGGIIIVFFISKDLLSFFFNNEIAEHFQVLIYCVVGAIFNYISAISNLVLTALEEHKLQKNIMLICVIVNILIMLIFVNSYGLIVLVSAFVIASCLRLFLSTGFVFYLLNKKHFN